ncbi:MAG: enolase, partial [Comamonas sp.]
MTTANPSPINAPLSADSIAWVRVSSCYLPLANPISDAKVLT